MLSCLEAFTATNCKNAAIKFAVSSVCLPVTTHEPLNRILQNLILWNLYWTMIAQSTFGENFKCKWTVCRPTCIKWDLPPVTTHEPLNRLPQNLILWNLYCNLIAQSAFDENLQFKRTMCRPARVKWDLPPVTTHEPLNRFPQNLIFWNLYWSLSAQSAFGDSFYFKWTMCRHTCIKWDLLINKDFCAASHS